VGVSAHWLLPIEWFEKAYLLAEVNVVVARMRFCLIINRPEFMVVKFGNQLAVKIPRGYRSVSKGHEKLSIVQKDECAGG